MAEENFVTLEVAIDDTLYERIIHAAANRGQYHLRETTPESFQ